VRLQSGTAPAADFDSKNRHRNEQTNTNTDKQEMRMNLTKTSALIATLLAANLIPLHAANRTWSGAGPDAKWSTPANWGGTAPVSADVLIFNGMTGLSNTNDLTNLTLGGLRFQSGGFQLYGNPLTALTTSAAGLVTNLAGLNTISLNISSLQPNKAWYVASGAEVVFAGAATSAGTSGGIVMLDGGGTVRFTGTVTAVRGLDLTNGTIIVDGGLVDHSNDGFRFKPRAGATALARLINNGTWRWGGGANFRLGNVSAAGTSRMQLESGTLELYGAAVSILLGDTAVAGATNLFTQTGGRVLSTGSGNNDLIMGTSSGAECIYNLDGGTLMIRRIRANSPGQGVFNFNGGTLVAKTTDAAFLQDLAAANVKAGGAVIDSSTFTVTIAQPLQEDAVSLGGGLTKLGAGTLNLTGASSYKGPTKLGRGGLGLIAAYYPTVSALIMSNSTVLNLDVTGGAAALAAPSVTLDDNVTLNLKYGTLSGNPSAPAISDATLTGTMLTARGTNLVLNVTGTGFVAGQFPLLKYSGGIGGNGFGAFVLGTLPTGVLGTLVHNTSSGSIDLLVTLVVNALTWNGSLNANWDINTTANWMDPLAAAATYQEYGTTNIVGDIVTFDDTLTNDFVNPQNTNIVLTTTLRPAIVNVAGFSTPYSFGGAGKLSGSAILNVGGSTSLKISTTNDHSGGSTLAAGTQTLLLGNDAALGTGPITLNGGTLSANDAAPLTLTNSTTMTAVTFGTDAAAGALAFSGPVSFGGAGRTLTFNSDVTLSGTVANGGLARKLGAGTLTYSGVTGTETAGDWQIEAGQIVVSGGNFAKSVGGLRIMATTPGGLSRFTLNSGTLTMTGNGQNLRIGSSSPAGDSTATNIATLAGTLTWTTNNVGGQVQMGANCAFAQLNLLSGGLLRLGTFTAQGTNNAEVNFDGGTLAPMASRADFMQGLTWANLRDGGLTVDTEGLSITIGQPLLAAGTGGVTKNGLGTLTLSGASTYSGLTLVNAGTLILGPAHSAPGSVTVADNAQLGLLSDALGASAKLASAAIGSSTGAGLLAKFTGSLGNPTAPAGYITNLTLNGTVPVSVQLAGLTVGTIPLVRYVTLSGGGAVTTGTLPQGVIGTVVNNPGTKTIELQVNSVTPLVWTAAGTNTWDVGVATNWTLNGSATSFQNGDSVRLDDSTANSYVLLAGALSPGSVLFSNSTAAYSVGTVGTGKLTGSTGITKDGTNNLTLGGANDYTGDVIVKNGLLTLGSATALGATAGGTYVSNGASLNVGNYKLANAEIVQIVGPGFGNLGALYSDAGGGNGDYVRDLRLAGDAYVGGASGVRYGFSNTNGTLTSVGGLHKFTKLGPAQFDLENATVTIGDIEVREGVLQAASGTTINPGYGITVQEGAELRIYQLVAPIPRSFRLNNGRINVTGGTGLQNELDGEIELGTNGTIQVGSGFVLTATKAVKGSGNLIKTSPGTFTLTAANSYTGSTVVSNGTLALAFGASIATSPSVFVNTGATLEVSAASPWTLGTGQSLSGGGAINGSVTANGTVSPGASIDTLTFNNDLTLTGTSIMEVSVDGGLTNDVVAVTGALAYGGMLKVVRIGTTALAVNDTFKLFNFLSAPAGSFSQILLPSDYAWDTTQLSVDGTVRVTGIAAPPTLGFTQIGTSLQFTWTGAYKLQAQTNSLAVGISTNWFDYPGGGTSGVTVPMDPDNGTVFFRLSTP
jgi:autotransporter-associated beta strand protein